MLCQMFMHETWRKGTVHFVIPLLCYLLLTLIWKLYNSNIHGLSKKIANPWTSTITVTAWGPNQAKGGAGNLPQGDNERREAWWLWVLRPEYKAQSKFFVSWNSCSPTLLNITLLKTDAPSHKINLAIAFSAWVVNTNSPESLCNADSA